MEIALFIQNIQEERAEVKSYHFPLRKVIAPQKLTLLALYIFTRWRFIYFPGTNPTAKVPLSSPTKTGTIMNIIKIKWWSIITIRIIMNIIVIVIFIIVQERHCGEISANRSSPRRSAHLAWCRQLLFLSWWCSCCQDDNEKRISVSLWLMAIDWGFYSYGLVVFLTSHSCFRDDHHICDGCVYW